MPRISAAHPQVSHNGARRARSVPWAALVLVTCSALALAAGVTHRPALGVAAALLLWLAWLPRAWARRTVAGVAGWLALGLVVLVPAAIGHIGLALMVLPVLVLGLLGVWFGRSLRRGDEPLIVRFIRLAEGDARLENPRVRAYARGVTVFWAMLLGVLAAWSLALALFAQPGGWFAVLGWPQPFALPGSLLAWYPEAGVWGVVAAAFAGEYAFRRWYLRGTQQAGAVEFIRQLVRYWPELMRGGRPA